MTVVRQLLQREVKVVMVRGVMVRVVVVMVVVRIVIVRVIVLRVALVRKVSIPLLLLGRLFEMLKPDCATRRQPMPAWVY